MGKGVVLALENPWAFGIRELKVYMSLGESMKICLRNGGPMVNKLEKYLSRGVIWVRD